MRHTSRLSWRLVGKKVRRQFLTGILVVLPLGATILILVWIFEKVDNILQPVIQLALGRTIPGVGFGITIVLIYLVGIIASNVIGKKIIKYGESLLIKIPVFRPLYSTIKQILGSFSSSGKTGLGQTVLVEFPRKGLWTIGFITNESPAQSGKVQLTIFIPLAPNPISGFIQIVSEEEVVRTDITIDEALKMIVSAGKVSPEKIYNKLSQRNE